MRSINYLEGKLDFDILSDNTKENLNHNFFNDDNDNYYVINHEIHGHKD